VDAHEIVLGESGLTAEQTRFARSVGAGPEHVLETTLPGRVFVYVDEPGRTIRHEVDELGRVLRSDCFTRDPHRAPR
jgi:hypothetical protein